MIIYILDYTISDSQSEYVIIGQVTLVCSLPLSALWASTDQQHHNAQPPTPRPNESRSTLSESVRRGRFTAMKQRWSARGTKDSGEEGEKAPSYSAESGESGELHGEV